MTHPVPRHRRARRALVRAVPPRGARREGRAHPPRRRLGQGEPLRLRPRWRWRAASPRWRTTPAATAAPTAPSAPPRSTTCRRCSTCCARRASVNRVAVRGSSMGGFQAILAAASRDGDVDAVVAICPAPEDLLLRGVRSGRLEGFEADREALRPGFRPSSMRAAAAALAPRTALLLMHARGDEQVPYTVSEELYDAAGEPEAPADPARRPPPLAAARRRDPGGIDQVHRARRAR